MTQVKALFSREFEMKDHGELKYFLDLEVARSSLEFPSFKGNMSYVLDLLKETGMLGSKPIQTPMDANVKIQVDSDLPMVEKGSYPRLVVKLIISVLTLGSSVNSWINLQKTTWILYTEFRDTSKEIQGKDFSSKNPQHEALQCTAMPIRLDLTLVGSLHQVLYICVGEYGNLEKYKPTHGSTRQRTGWLLSSISRNILRNVDE